MSVAEVMGIRRSRSRADVSLSSTATLLIRLACVAPCLDLRLAFVVDHGTSATWAAEKARDAFKDVAFVRHGYQHA